MLAANKWLLSTARKGAAVSSGVSESAIPNKQALSVAIVSRPGMMQQSLRALLAAQPWIAVAAVLGDGLTAVNHVTRHKPALLVIDCNLLDEEVAALLAALHAGQWPTRCLVLTRSDQRTAWALASGADAAMLRDNSLPELLAVLTRFHADQI